MKISNVLIIVSFAFLSFSCHKDSATAKDCGCCGTIYKTLDNIKGSLSKTPDGNNEIWILKGYSFGPYYFKICNGDAVKDLWGPGSDEVPVVFSGDLYRGPDTGGMQTQDATLRGSITIHSIKNDAP